MFGPFLGHIVEFEGKKGLFVTGQSRRTWSVATIYLVWPFSPGFGAVLAPKKMALGHQMRNFGRAPPDLAPPPRGATGEFWAQNLELARAPPRL